MSNFDFYAAARELIFRFEQEGLNAEAAKLRSAMIDGATGTEICMALRFHLAEIVRQVPLRGDSLTYASRLLSELNDVLE